MMQCSSAIAILLLVAAGGAQEGAPARTRGEPPGQRAALQRTIERRIAAQPGKRELLAARLYLALSEQRTSDAVAAAGRLMARLEAGLEKQALAALVRRLREVARGSPRGARIDRARKLGREVAQKKRRLDVLRGRILRLRKQFQTVGDLRRKDGWSNRRQIQWDIRQNEKEMERTQRVLRQLETRLLEQRRRERQRGRRASDGYRQPMSASSRSSTSVKPAAR